MPFSKTVLIGVSSRGGVWCQSITKMPCWVAFPGERMTEGDKSPKFNRRKVLKLTSAAAIGSTALTGAASANQGKGRGQGPPFLEPTTELVNFCGCTSVCIGDLPECSEATIVYKGGRRETVSDQDCYDRGEIKGVENEEGGDTVFYCNPNTACSGNEEADCDEVGTAPQFGGGGCG